MTENEDKLLQNSLIENDTFTFLIFWKYVFNNSIDFKKLLEALLLEYIGFIQYGIYL